MATDTQPVRQRIHKKSLIVLLIIAFLIIGAALFGYLVWSKNNLIITTPQTALVSVISGTPQVSTDGQTYQNVPDGTTITAGSTIKTDANTRVLLVFSDNSVVTVDFNSQLKLDTINQNRVENDVTIIQQLGKIFSQVEKIVGVQENYQVNANGLVAAVRGTKFGTGIQADGQVRVYVKESKVAVSLADPNQPQSQSELILQKDKQIVTPTNQGLSGDQFNQHLSDFQSDGSDWDKLNDCLSQTLDSIQLPNQTNYNFIQLKYKDLITACLPKAPGTPTAVTPTPAPAPAPAIPLATVTSVTDNGDYTTTPSITCVWTAANASTYSFAIGTYPGYTDTVNWLTQTATSYSNGNLPLTYGPKYYCTVLPTGPGGTAGWKTSDGIYYDNVTGTLTVNSPAVGASLGRTKNVIQASGALSNPAANSDVQASFYIQLYASSPGPLTFVPPPTCQPQYSNGSTWTSSITWFNFTGPLSNLTTTIGAFPGGAGSFCLGVRLVNTKTGKVLVSPTLAATFQAGARIN